MPSKPRLSYANVMSTIAVFTALGGTSYAAITVTGKNVKNNSLTGADVKDRSLLAKDFKKGQLPAGAQGPAGPAGETGARGETGAQGPAGPTHRARVLANGNLFDGTALSSVRLGTGNYVVTFPTAVDKCAAVAATTIFAGYDATFDRIDARTEVGRSATGSVSPNTVVVVLHDGSSATTRDSAFALILSCP